MSLRAWRVMSTRRFPLRNNVCSAVTGRWSGGFFAASANASEGSCFRWGIQGCRASLRRASLHSRLIPIVPWKVLSSVVDSRGVVCLFPGLRLNTRWTRSPLTKEECDFRVLLSCLRSYVGLNSWRVSARKIWAWMRMRPPVFPLHMWVSGVQFWRTAVGF
jgi:hypothetical protein